MSSLPDLLLQHARERPDAPAIREKRRGRWNELTWGEYADRVARIAGGLRELGVQPGDRVAIHSENRPEWVLADLAIQGIGAVSVGVYPTSPAAEVEYLLGHSESVVLIAEDEEQLDKALAVRERLPALRHIVLIDPRNVRELGDVTTWEQLEDREPLEGYGQGIDESDTAVIVYTSGTTGPPKGAMLTHANLTWAADCFHRAFGTGPEDEVLSYLPLCHVAERLGSVINGLGTGYVVNFGEGGESFAQDLRDVQPTLFAAVPRVWEKMLATVEIKMTDASRAQALVVPDGDAARPRPPREPAGPARPARQARARPRAARDLRRRPHRPPGARVLLDPGRPGLRDLRPDREHRGLHADAVRRRADRHRRQAAGGGRAEDRRGRRDPHALAGRVRRLLQGPRRHRRRRSTPTAGSTPATSGRSTTTATSRSPTARRT